MCLFILGVAGCLGRCEARDRHSERAAGDVVVAEAVEVSHRGGLAAMLAAHAVLDRWVGLGAEGGSHLHKLPDALLIEHLKQKGIIRLFGWLSGWFWKE